MKKARNGFTKTLPYLCLVGVIALGLMTIVGTGGGGGDGNTPSPTTCENVAGTWTTDEYVDATDCDEGTTYWEYDNTYTVTQNGCNITVVPSTGGSYSGTVNGNQITWTGSWPEDEGGTTTATINLTISGDDLSGSASWTWTNGTSCSGTTQISGTRSVPPPATVTGTLTLPSEASGKEYFVIIDNDTDGGNGYVNDTIGTCGSGTTVDYSINNVPAGTYYAYACVRVVSAHDSPPESGDYFGFYGTGSTEPSEANAVVPSSGTVVFDITLSEIDDNGEDTASVRFFNNLLCLGSPFTATLVVCGASLNSQSGSWSSCETVTPGTCSFSVYADTQGCGTITMSGSISLDSDCVYNFVLVMDGPNVALGYTKSCPGDCGTPTPFSAGASLESLSDDDSFELLMEVPIEGEGLTTAQ